jgi:hypothetical protein
MQSACFCWLWMGSTMVCAEEKQACTRFPGYGSGPTILLASNNQAEEQAVVYWDESLSASLKYSATAKVYVWCKLQTSV